MPHSKAALKPLSADALTPKVSAASKGLHPASQHSLSARPAPLAAAASETPVSLQAAPPVEETPAPPFAVLADLPRESEQLEETLPMEDDWAEMMASFSTEAEDEEPLPAVEKKQKKHDESNDFMQNLPTPVPVSLFEEEAAPSTPRWRWLIWGGVLLAAAAAGVYVYFRFWK